MLTLRPVTVSVAMLRLLPSRFQALPTSDTVLLSLDYHSPVTVSRLLDPKAEPGGHDDTRNHLFYALEFQAQTLLLLKKKKNSLTSQKSSFLS